MASLATVSPAAALDLAPAPDASNTVVAEQQQAPSSFTFQGTSQVCVCVCCCAHAWLHALC
jgi:hypothetical protein